ncbi:TMEM198/TM7SF3 family protein [Candidatus Fermentibacteria bacterium]|nr:TMEM198/TM7SF3 family protein [Candidatus Fermentibacteria bacterium]
MIPRVPDHPAAWGFLALGLLFCFLGRRLFTFFLACSGFILGFTAGSLLFENLEGLLKPALSSAAGLACAALSIVLLRLSMFLGGAAAGFVSASGLLGLDLLPSLAVALAAGVLTALLTKQFLSVLTAASGALTAVAGATVLFDNAALPSYAAPVLAAALAIAGAIVQMKDLHRSS